MFKLKICLLIRCVTRISASGSEIAIATKDNELPTIEIKPCDSKKIETLIDKLFVDVTKLSSRWAELDFIRHHVVDDTIVLFYGAILSKHDALFKGYEWNTYVNSINTYGFNMSQYMNWGR